MVAIIVIDLMLTSPLGVLVTPSLAKIYLAPDAQLLRQDTRDGMLTPMMPSAFYGWLPQSLAPGALGGVWPCTFPSGPY